MKLAMRLPEKTQKGASNDSDPREGASAEVIDLASRTAYPAVAGRKGKSDALGLAAGVGFVALLGAATLWGLNASRTSEGEPVAAPVAPAVDQAAIDQAAIDAAAAEAQAAALIDPAGPAPDPILSRAPQSAPVPINQYASPTVVFDASGAATPIPANAAPSTGTENGQVPTGGSAGEFAARVGGVGGGPAIAQQNIDPATTVTQGTMIPAILETAIDTDVPGYVRAVVSQDVRSFDGSRVLIPRSSRLVGQYQSGLQAGQKRAYVIWGELIRPDGVTVKISSPATGFDGTTGLAGEVDGHFFSRFGSAMLLSVIGGLTAVASGGASIILGGGQSAASTALEQDGQRPPTVRVGLGAPIRVYTARHLDFSQAPEL